VRVIGKVKGQRRLQEGPDPSKHLGNVDPLGVRHTGARPTLALLRVGRDPERTPRCGGHADAPDLTPIPGRAGLFELAAGGRDAPRPFSDPRRPPPVGPAAPPGYVLRPSISDLGPTSWIPRDSPSRLPSGRRNTRPTRAPNTAERHHLQPVFSGGVEHDRGVVAIGEPGRPGRHSIQKSGYVFGIPRTMSRRRTGTPGCPGRPHAVGSGWIHRTPNCLVPQPFQPHRRLSGLSVCD
jgi:hypothetical protein